MPLNDQFLTVDRDHDGFFLGHDLFMNADLTRLDLLRVGIQLLFLQLEFVRSFGRIVSSSASRLAHATAGIVGPIASQNVVSLLLAIRGLDGHYSAPGQKLTIVIIGFAWCKTQLHEGVKNARPSLMHGVANLAISKSRVL